MRWATSDQIRALTGVESPGLLAWDPTEPLSDGTRNRLVRELNRRMALANSVPDACTRAVRRCFHPPTPTADEVADARAEIDAMARGSFIPHPGAP